MLIKSLFAFLLLGSLPLSVLAEQSCDSSKPASAPMSRFKDGGSGTLVDTQGKKVWLRCTLGMSWNGSSCEGNSLTYSWSGAEAVVAELNAKQAGGHTNWRLPTVDELNGVVEKQCFRPAINLQAFPFSPEAGFWTATTAEGINPRAWIVHFLHGQQYVANKEQSWRVRPIADK